jgi:hypothetical protein
MPVALTAISAQVLMAVLERVLSDQWTEAMATAWGGLWQVCGVEGVELVARPRRALRLSTMIRSFTSC